MKTLTLHTTNKFPELTVLSTIGTISLPEFYRGKSFIAFYLPGNLNPAYAMDLALIARNVSNFRDKGCEVLALMDENILKLYEWTDWIRKNHQTEIHFPLCSISKNDKKVLNKLNKNKKQKELSVFFINEDGDIQKIIKLNGQVQDSLPNIYKEILKMNDCEIDTEIMSMDLLGR